MATLSTTQISIAGNTVPSFQSLKIEQQLDQHHHLELICRTDVLESSSTELVGESKDFLAETITVMVKADLDYEGYRELQFKGIVTKVKTVKGFHKPTGDLIVIEAKSMSILAEDGHHSASHVDKSLSEILESTFQGYDAGKLETAFAPRQFDTLHYSVQQKESSFSYASRLASNSNNWFYYDGTKLVFGEPGTQETPLAYAIDLQELSIEIDPKPNNFSYFTHDYLSDELYEKKTSEVNGSNSGYHNLASNKSAVLYSKETKIYHNPYTDTQLQQRFDTQVEHHTQAIESKQVIATGVSDNPGVNLGEVINIEGYGSFRVISVTHTNTETGNYKNHFEAITTDLDVYPNTDMMRYPVSNVEKAVVMENIDPDGLGRITVQFPWQEPMGETTPFLRVLTPHAGADKGFYFIPEIGEEIICQFESNNAERPYVAGSLYNGNNKPESWQTDNNDVKAIRTRSGHTIELNDTEGEEKIKIYDNEGSILIFDTQAKSLTINATETIDISAKNINITAEENINIGAQENVEIAAQADLNALAEGNVALQSSGDTTIKSNATIAVEAVSDATIKGQNAIVEGLAGAEVNGVQTKVTGSAMTEVSGALLKLN